MISFTDKRIYAKGTCNVLCEELGTNKVVFQSNKMTSGSITPSTSLNEIRAGLGNPIAIMIPSDSGLTVDFDFADFQMWAKAAQLGQSVTYSAPVPVCKTVTASGETLTVDVSDGVPVAELGKSKAVCHIQKVGAASLMAADGVAYDISSAGVVSGFTAENGVSYKVWYFVQKATAKKVVVTSFIDPKVVRFTAQIAVYCNDGNGADSQGTRIGWLYYIIPYLKLQADATVTGDQTNNDTTKISGQAIAYDSEVVSATCTDCDSSVLGYMVYVPDDDAGEIQGLAVVGGVVSVVKDASVQIPVRFVMADGSLVVPPDYSELTYALASGGSTYASISSAGVLSGTAAGDTEATISYEDSADVTHTCVINVSVTAA